MLVLPADHLISDVKAFHQSVGTAARAASQGRLATFGIVAGSPETGYGYIRRGNALAGVDGAYAVAAFVEKPDLDTAAVVCIQRRSLLEQRNVPVPRQGLSG